MYSKIQLVPSQPGTLVQARLYDRLETTVDPRVSWRRVELIDSHVVPDLLDELGLR